jgi:hypothetical protein
MLRLPSLIAGLCAGLFAAPWLQDPVKPAPPTAEKPAEKPVEKPAEKPASTPANSASAPAPADVAGHAKPNPLEGVYRLTARVIAGKRDAGTCRGYLAITQRHLFLCLAAPGPDRDTPLLRAGVRTWKAVDGGTEASIQLGWYNDKDGKLHLETPGTEERRRVEFIQGGLRVLQDDHNWLEFERVE